MSFFFVRTFRCYDSHHHFVKLFVFICGDMNGVTPWLRAIFVSLYHKESLNSKNSPRHIKVSFPREFEKWCQLNLDYSTNGWPKRKFISENEGNSRIRKSICNSQEREVNGHFWCGSRRVKVLSKLTSG